MIIKKVDEWRREQAILRTIERRPDLLKKSGTHEKRADEISGISVTIL